MIVTGSVFLPVSFFAYGGCSIGFDKLYMQKRERIFREARRLIKEGKQNSVREALLEVYGYFAYTFYVYECRSFFDCEFDLESMSEKKVVPVALFPKPWE